jgi:tetratricopeptide (TPR) repeat protein
MTNHHNVQLYSVFQEDSETLDRLLRDNPNNFWALVQQGRLYDFNGDFNHVVVQFKKALSVLSLDNNANDLDQIKAAIDNYNTNADQTEQITNRDVSDLFNYWALSLKSLGNTDDALLYYGKAIIADPTNATPYNNRGLLYLNLGDDEQAIQDFNQAIELKPDYAIPYCNRGIIEKNRGLRKKAESDYKKAIQLDHTFAEPCYNLGLLYFDEKQYREAIKSFKMAIKLNKHYTLAYFNLGVAYSQIKAYFRSYYYVKKAYELEPDNPLIRKALMGEDG